jgi:hypothetical protein
MAHGVASLGGSHATWRKELTLQSKTRLIRKLRSHVITELRYAKLYFISDHELLLSFLDYTLDSSGLFTFVILYDFHHLYWFLWVLVELSLYAIFGAFLKSLVSWQIRNYLLFSINGCFGIATYLASPYTEEKDKWFDFCGRILISLVAIGEILYIQVSSQLVENAFVPMYTPWKNFHYFTELFTSVDFLTFGVVIDLLIVIYFYSYLFYLLYAIGFFGMMERSIKSLQFSYHDHILDFLINKLDVRFYGYENIFIGLEFIQQWDDILKLQRRYALLSWPDIRPTNLITFTEKLVEVKWGALFNLTLKNLRSSLGLTMLHTTMFQADSEVSRWIIYSNPELLLVSDSQNDTPITIALKECAYYLMVYGDQNEGYLDDHTTYNDEDYAIYYAEIDEVRDDIFQNGEFIEELSIVHLLTAQDLIRVTNEGRYIEPKPLDLAAEEKMINEKKEKKKTTSSYASIKFASMNTYDETMSKRKEDELLKAIKLSKRKKKLWEIKAQTERNSLILKRFPEDDIYDNFESGLNSSWSILRYSVPCENLYIDRYLYNRYLKFPTFHYENNYTGRTAIKNIAQKMNDNDDDDPKRRGRKGKKGRNVASNIEKGLMEFERNNDLNAEEEEKRRLLGDENGSEITGFTTDLLDRFIAKDIQYVIPGHNPIHLLEEKVVVSLADGKLQQLAKEYPDWDRKNRHSQARRNSSFSIGGGGSDSGRSQSPSASSHRKDSFSGSVRSTGNQSNYSDTSGGGLLEMFRGERLGEKDVNNRLSAWKICKFAEILMSKEINEACSTALSWDLNDFKAFNKLASINQGKIAQHLALVCHLNPPEGFVRLSDWSIGNLGDVYDERPEEELNPFIKGVLTFVSTVENAAVTLSQVNDFMKTTIDVKKLHGRNKRQRSTRRSSKNISIRASDHHHGGGDGDFGGGNVSSSSIHNREKITDGMLSDRVIHYLAETFVCSSNHLILDDCELSYNARRGWRAIARVLRRRYCSFILPSVFMAPKPVIIFSLVLTRNELDCGDCVFIADILMNQPQLR